MRRLLFLITVVSTFASQAQPEERSWSVGYAQADITPAPGQVQMSGFGRERYARGVLAPLPTQAVVLRDIGDNTGVLITADILDLDHVMVEAIRRAIGHRHGIPVENTMFVASHTHWGPAVRFRMGFSLGAPNVWYMGHLEQKILACVDAGTEKLAAATIEYGWFDFRGIGCNRRLPVDGKITWGPYRQGSFDAHTPVLRIRRKADPQQLLVVGHACHPTSSGTIGKWSPDYPGAMRDYLATEMSRTPQLVRHPQ